MTVELNDLELTLLVHGLDFLIATEAHPTDKSLAEELRDRLKEERRALWTKQN